MQRRQREGASWKQRGESFGISVNGLDSMEAAKGRQAGPGEW